MSGTEEGIVGHSRDLPRNYSSILQRTPYSILIGVVFPPSLISHRVIPKVVLSPFSSIMLTGNKNYLN